MENLNEYQNVINESTMAHYLFHICFIKQSIGNIDVAIEDAIKIAEETKNENLHNTVYWEKVIELIPDSW